MNTLKNPTSIIIVLLFIGIIAVGGFWFIKNNQNATTDTQKTISSQTGNLPPQAAIDACASKAIGDTCEFSDNGNTAQGVCDDKPGVLACRKNDATNGEQNTNQDNKNFYDPQKSSYSIEQAISDRAQETTIAYDALAFFTGNTCADSFMILLPIVLTMSFTF